MTLTMRVVGYLVKHHGVESIADDTSQDTIEAIETKTAELLASGEIIATKRHTRRRGK